MLANGWARAGHRVFLITFDSPGTKSAYPLDTTVQVRQLELRRESRNLLDRLVHAARRIWKIRQLFDEIDPDAIVSFVEQTNVLVLVGTIYRPWPVIVADRVDPVAHKSGALTRWGRRGFYRRAAKIVVQSESVRKSYHESIRARCKVINNFVSLPEHNPSCSEEKQERRPVIIGMGRLVPQKGFDILIRSFSKIAEKYPNWTLTIYGEGSERQILEALIHELGLGHRIHLPGVAEDVGQVFSEMSIFVLSSRYEGFPNVLLEAMSYGVAVISFDCPSGPREIIRDRHDGILIAPESVDGLSSAMCSLIADEPERIRLGQHARRSVNRYAPDKVMPLWSALIEPL